MIEKLLLSLRYKTHIHLTSVYGVIDLPVLSVLMWKLRYGIS
jgi:hypothetical protein